MEKPSLKDRLKKLWEALAAALSYRTKPGCATCMTPVMDEDGKPVVAHCSQWGAPTGSSGLADGTDLTGE